MHDVEFYQRIVGPSLWTRRRMHAAWFTELQRIWCSCHSVRLAWKQRSGSVREAYNGTFHVDSVHASVAGREKYCRRQNHSDTELIRAKTASENKTQFSNVFTDIGG